MKLLKLPQKSPSYEVFSNTLVWNFRSGTKKIPVKIQVFDSIPRTRASDAPPTFIINGLGEGVFSAKIPPQFLAENVVSIILPFDRQVPLDDPKNIEKIMVAVPKFVAKNRLKIINRHRSFLDKRRSFALIARSQGGPASVISIAKFPRLFSQLALLAPFGFNMKNLGKNEAEQTRELLLRLGFGALKSNLLDAGNLRSSIEVVQHLKKIWQAGELEPMFYAALTFDMIDALDKIATPKKICVFVGRDDPVFRPEELQKNLAHVNVSIRTLRGVHETIGSRSGREQVRVAYQWLNSPK